MAACGHGPRRVRADEAAADHVALSRLDGDCGVREAIDHEALDDGVVRTDLEGAGGAVDSAPIDLDEEHGIVSDGQRVRAGARLGVAVDDHGIGHHRQDGGRRDGADGGRARATGPRDAEGDRVGDADGRVRLVEGVAQRAHAAIIGVGHRVGCGGKRVGDEQEGDDAKAMGDSHGIPSSVGAGVYPGPFPARWIARDRSTAG